MKAFYSTHRVYGAESIRRWFLLLCSRVWLSPRLIKTRCEVCCLFFWHFAVYVPDMGWGQDPRKRRADFCFQNTAGNFDAKFLRGKRHGPDPAHLRVLWWNNSKCLSCIVWHAAGGVLKPLLPVPKAPLNKIVKNKSFTLIFPIDYCTQGGKLAADPRAFLSLTLLQLYLQVPLSCSISVHRHIPCGFLVAVQMNSPWHSGMRFFFLPY